MEKNNKDVILLIAEDDDDDYLLTKKAFQDAHFLGSLCRVKDGEELMAFLLSKHSRLSPAHGKVLLLLLDLNMPRKDGREALKEIKSHPDLKRIPVVVLTTSLSEADVIGMYELGANSFIKKPTSYGQFVDCIKEFKKYWLEVAELPCLRNVQTIP
jgi:two-component system response regulator